MAYVCTLSDGTTTVDLNSAAGFELRYGGVQLGLPVPVRAMTGTGLYHDGEWPVARRYSNRQVSIRLIAHATSKDNLASQITSLNQLLRDALQSYAEGYGSVVYLTWQPDGATSPLYYDVVDGQLEMPDGWSGVIWTRDHDVIDAVLALDCLPFGRGVQVDLPDNVCTNPDFEALTTGWAATNAALAVSTTQAWEGIKSLRITPSGVSPASADYDLASGFTAGGSFTVQVRVYLPSGGVTGSNVTLQVGDTTGAYEYTSVTAANTYDAWQLLTCTRSVRGGAAGVRIRLNVATTDAGHLTYWDGVYAWDGAASLNPDSVWISHYVLKTDNDDADVYHNYLAAKSVPGDAPAATRLRLKNPDAGAWAGDQWYCHRWRAGLGNHLQFRDAEDYTLGGATAVQADATASGLNVARVTGAGSGAYAARLTGGGNYDYDAGRFRVLMRAKIDAGTGYVKILLNSGGATLFTSAEVTFTNTAFAILNLGIIEWPPFAVARGLDYAMNIIFQTKADTTGRLLDIDWTMFFDLETLIAIDPTQAFAQNHAIELNALTEAAFIGRYLPNASPVQYRALECATADGLVPLLVPNDEQRFYVEFEAGDINDSMQVAVSYRPRWLGQVGR